MKPEGWSSSPEVQVTYSAAQLFVDIIEALSRRAPAIVATAAHQLQTLSLGLHFGDGSEAELHAQHSRLLASTSTATAPDVEAYLDNRSLNLLFDLARHPADEVLVESLDLRGHPNQLLAVWRAFRLLSQRASGLRNVQAMWQKYREQYPEVWGQPPPQNIPSMPADLFPPPRDTGWRALDYLDHRFPAGEDSTGPRVTGGTIVQETRTLWNGRQSTPWWRIPETQDSDLMETMERAKQRVREELVRIIPDREPKEKLYDLIRDYPSRGGKGLRPTLTFATCAAFGGNSEDAVRTAAAIELFHNGFLVHDDISDESLFRRNYQTLHEAYSIGLAVNTGDAMNLLAIDTILSNLSTLGLARTLGLIHEILHMCRETLEGQAMELGWIHDHLVPPHDEDYFTMSTKKTGWYTIITPCRIGAICAGETDPVTLSRLNEVFRLVGIAFQIQDDVLNLVGETRLYGKEPLGDLLEGKRTIMMIHLFREADPPTRARMEELIRLPRTEKTQADAEEMLAAMERLGSIEYGIALADRLAHEGVRHFEEDLTFMPETEAKGVLRQIANYVTTRPL
jgi:geranylgeranyl diphosphate synthase type II